MSSINTEIQLQANMYRPKFVQRLKEKELGLVKVQLSMRRNKDLLEHRLMDRIKRVELWTI